MAQSGKFMVRKTTLGVITVATNKYVDYWEDLARSFASNPSPDLEVTLHVFTEQREVVDRIASTIPISVISHEVPGFQWPQASLYRFKLIQEFREKLTEEFLMHLDADMLVRAPIGSKQISGPLRNGICLVRHPGYFRPSGLAKMLFYLRNPLATLPDLATMLRVGSLGAWESNTQSLAFVSREDREQYFCGATWWGLRADIVGLSESLSNRISRDEDRGVTAVWHDESHLNWWASKNEHGQADSRYCFSVGYPQLRGIPNIIEAKHK
jgi:hypothetical protein